MNSSAISSASSQFPCSIKSSTIHGWYKRALWVITELLGQLVCLLEQPDAFGEAALAAHYLCEVVVSALRHQQRVCLQSERSAAFEVRFPASVARSAPSTADCDEGVREELLQAECLGEC